MSKSKRRHIYSALSFSLLATFLIAVVMPAKGGPIEADGRTETQVDTQGDTTDVSTDTTRGDAAYNSFSRFNVNKDHTANLYLPDGTENLLNLVHDEKTRIDGLLNAYKDGHIGGDVFFMNPHGIIVGESGTLNVGSLSASTPTPEFMDNMIDPAGNISDKFTQKALDGSVPLTDSGLIRVDGSINAAEDIEAQAGEVTVGSSGS